MPTHATGTPGGIWAIASSASNPPATDVDDVSGTPSLVFAYAVGSGINRVTTQRLRKRGLEIAACGVQLEHVARDDRLAVECALV